MVTGEADIGLRQAPISPIIQVGLVDYWVYLLMVTRELDIGLRPATFLHRTIGSYKFSTQYPLKNIPQGLYEEKILKTDTKGIYYIHIKIILIMLIQACHHILIKACHHTIFVCVHIELLLLFIQFTELNKICIYHHSVIYIVHHPVILPPTRHQTYFLLIFVLIHQGGYD